MKNLSYSFRRTMKFMSEVKNKNQLPFLDIHIQQNEIKKESYATSNI